MTCVIFFLRKVSRLWSAIDINKTIKHRRGSRILQGQVSNPSERGTAPPPISLTHVTGTKQFFGLRRNSWRQAVVRHLELCQILY